LKDTLTGVRLSRRSLARAAVLVAGTLLCPGAARPALARHGWGDGGCFLRGTRIRTVQGYRHVESLQAGDLLPTRFGGWRPIVAVHRHTATRNRTSGFWAREDRPVRIGRSALGEGAPRKDLYLTSAHALFIDEVLVPVGNLVNNTSIAFDDMPGRDHLEYFHVELEDHDVIDADGAACETLLHDVRSDAAVGPGRASARVRKERCAPLLAFNGGRNELRSRLRSATCFMGDRRNRLDMIRDRLEERGLAASKL